MSPTKKYILDLLRTPFGTSLVLEVELGQGAIVLQRIRSEISRVRAAMKEEGITYQSFTLAASTRTDREKMIDVIELTREITGRNTMQTSLQEAMNLMKKDANDGSQLS